MSGNRVRGGSWNGGHLPYLKARGLLGGLFNGERGKCSSTMSPLERDFYSYGGQMEANGDHKPPPTSFVNTCKVLDWCRVPRPRVSNLYVGAWSNYGPHDGKKLMWGAGMAYGQVFCEGFYERSTNWTSNDVHGLVCVYHPPQTPWLHGWLKNPTLNKHRSHANLLPH